MRKGALIWCLLVVAQAFSLLKDTHNSRKLFADDEPTGSAGRLDNHRSGKRGKRGKMGSDQTDDTLGDFQRRPKKGKKIRLREKSDLFPQIVPVLGPHAVNGTKPMIGSHSGRDAIFALAANYPLELFKFFVGSVRRFGFKDDIVLAVNPKKSMQPNTFQYLVEQNVVAYGFEVDCRKKDDCKLRDDFFGSVYHPFQSITLLRYPDPRPYRPFANIRYALYG
jgi:hypothetical protein